MKMSSPRNNLLMESHRIGGLKIPGTKKWNYQWISQALVQPGTIVTGSMFVTLSHSGLTLVIEEVLQEEVNQAINKDRMSETSSYPEELWDVHEIAHERYDERCLPIGKQRYGQENKFCFFRYILHLHSSKYMFLGEKAQISSFRQFHGLTNVLKLEDFSFSCGSCRHSIMHLKLHSPRFVN